MLLSLLILGKPPIDCVRWIATVNGETRVGLTFAAKIPDLDPSSILKFKIGNAETSAGITTKKPLSFIFSGSRTEDWNQTEIKGALQPSVEITERYRFWGKLKIEKFHLVSNQKEDFQLNPKTRVDIYGVKDFYLGPEQTIDLGPDDAVIGVTVTGPPSISLKKIGKEPSFATASYKGQPVSLFKIRSVSSLNKFGEYFTFRQVTKEEKFKLDAVQTIDCPAFEIKEKLDKTGVILIENHPGNALKALGL